ncbi:MAG: aspartate carbamoyltransferase [Oligoflexia bacterium]|nr:MAG: aspartate carbamoyltransferase [Oligoflexia bacterium]
MPLLKSSFLDLQGLSIEKIHQLFSLARKIKTSGLPPKFRGETLGLLFFEASTRTRMSFETAAYRVGLGPILLDGGLKTSLEKGESIEDSIYNVAAMRPRFLVIRCGDDVDLKEVAQNISVPIINAGWGKQGHPTQALLDAFTMVENLGDLRGRKILFLGDIRHSRVAASHFELLKILGAEIALCGPEEFMPLKHEHKYFGQLSEALSWADVAMALRCQFERHVTGVHFSKETYRAQFGLNSENLKKFSSKGLIMHPGPINHGIEMETEVLNDPRCRVLDQVTHGVYLREALLRSMMGQEYTE